MLILATSGKGGGGEEGRGEEKGRRGEGETKEERVIKDV